MVIVNCSNSFRYEEPANDAPQKAAADYGFCSPLHEEAWMSKELHRKCSPPPKLEYSQSELKSLADAIHEAACDYARQENLRRHDAPEKGGPGWQTLDWKSEEPEKKGKSEPLLEQQIEKPKAGNVPTTSAQVLELYNLKYSTGKHRTPDAVVYVPHGFDQNKPIRVVVYNHGLSTDAKEAFCNSDLRRQMENADANTILIVPEWQTIPQSRISKDTDRMHQPGFFKNMLDEVFSKTPALRGMTSKDIASIGLITHSGGYKATASQMYRNGLFDKVTSLTVLDSMYNPTAFDRWVSENIGDLAAGRKHLLVVYTDHLRRESNGLAERITGMLKREGMNSNVLWEDKNNPKTVTASDELRRSGIVFKYSSLKANGRDAHNTMTSYYVREVINSERSARN
ncbi:MAG TPA: hypothetical protein V6D17_16995 [Candidatus Obscuribacterales bacterium]